MMKTILGQHPATKVSVELRSYSKLFFLLSALFSTKKLSLPATVSMIFCDICLMYQTLIWKCSIPSLKIEHSSLKWHFFVIVVGQLAENALNIPKQMKDEATTEKLREGKRQA